MTDFMDAFFSTEIWLCSTTTTTRLETLSLWWIHIKLLVSFGFFQLLNLLPASSILFGPF